jgi:AcrR family transcriptional regulator
VATKSGLPVGSVYWHFESKDLLIAALIDASFEKWHAEAGERNKPLPGESFEDHVSRIFIGSNPQRFIAADFWRLGVILSVEKSVPEQVARKRFLKIRERQRSILTSGWEETISRKVLAYDPGLPSRLSAFTLAFQDGNAIAGTSGETLEDFHRLLAACLIHLVNQAEGKMSQSSHSSRIRIRSNAPAQRG